MSRIDQTFKRLKIEGQAALIPFIVAGDPDLETTEALVRKMAECGADIIEIGVPFSDPLADGPTIQAASHRALQKGVGLKEIFNMAKKFEGVQDPSGHHDLFQSRFPYGLKDFRKDCQRMWNRRR